MYYNNHKNGKDDESLNYKKEEIKKGITLHTINTNKFKTNLFAVFITMPINKETVTMNALLPLVLKRGSMNIKSQDKISEKLEEMYGSALDCGIDKSGNNQVIKFYLESLNDNFIPSNENIAKESLNLMFDIIFNPLIEENKFNEEYVNTEKNVLKQIIESKIDNKARYAFERCIEEMYKNEAYGIYKFGYTNDLEKIDSASLFERYKEIIKSSKIDILASGENLDNISEIIKNNCEIEKLNERNPNYNITGQNEEKKEKEEQIVVEKMDVTQGKLVIGLDLLNQDENKKYASSVYNLILGGSANSKLFQNVREKASLCYTANSSYLRQKNNIIIRCGIEIENYEKALNLIKKQLEEIENKEFTEEDIEKAKNVIISSVKGIEDSQDAEISYYFGQELANKFVSIDEYIKNIEKVNIDEVVETAKNVQINTIYFLRNN